MWMWSLLGYFLLFSASSQDTNHLELFWNLYTSVVRGSRILHDVTEGVGAVSKAIRAIDTFLDSPPDDHLIIQEDPKSQQELYLEGTPKVTSTENVNNNNPIFTPDDVLPSFSGCGALGFHIRDENLPVRQLTECCSVQDRCYLSSCKVNKRDCDFKLKSCLFSICEKDLLADKNSLRNCKGAAKLLFSGTMALSFKQYNDAQTSLGCKGKSNRWKKGS